VLRVTGWRCGVALALVACAACSGEPNRDASASRSATPKGTGTSTAKANPTPSTRPTGAAGGRRSQPPMPGCLKGWVEPKRSTALRSLPLSLLRETQGFDAPFSVVDMRYFKGPDDTDLTPESSATEVERWYGKVIYTKDKRFKIRFLVRRSSVGAGVVAVAPFATRGFAEGDWRGFEGEGEGERTYPGLPGRWTGAAYDYVARHQLPPEVRGCLADEPRRRNVRGLWRSGAQPPRVRRSQPEAFRLGDRRAARPGRSEEQRSGPARVHRLTR
jgi:hypothetical protein